MLSAWAVSVILYRRVVGACCNEIHGKAKHARSVLQRSWRQGGHLPVRCAGGTGMSQRWLAMKIRVAIIGLFGLLIVGYLIWHVGFGSVFAAVLAIGWRGFSLLCLYALAVFVLLGSGWWVLVAEAPQGWRTFIWARLVRDSAAETLPFSQIGGYVIGVRAAILDGVAPAVATASMIADITTELIAQLVYICIGIALLSTRLQRAAGLPSMAWLLTAVAVSTIAAACFYAVQRYGRGTVRIITSRFLPMAADHTDAVAAELQSIYRAPGRVALSFLFHLAGWIASGAATWIAFRVLGAQVSLTWVIAVESLIYGIRSVAFAVPNALGVQEAAYAVLAPLFGVGPEIGLAISLIKRARDIAIGIPVLLLWQALEGSRAVASVRTGQRTS
jgi:glycosyltransferase 2 family protein